ncbi:MAG: PilZ domain-containing protein [Bdellovibrionaceae bacterium]|nr:PilZ domain-containing protein [Pseudobdellovibrionaceae bacterium]NUM60470.1 PilZ domain-containing protein [Pseudobdellovibrionaceae bacterium]
MQEISKRFSTHENAIIEIYGRMGTLQGTMKNLSQSGCFVELTKGEYIPKEGDCVQITISLKSVNRTRVITGQVVWNKGLGFGITFVKKEDIVKKMLNRYQIDS